jgi:hypothetical protein
VRNWEAEQITKFRARFNTAEPVLCALRAGLEIRWGRLQLDIQYSTPSEKTMFMSNCVRTIPHAGVGRMYST